MNEYSDLTTAAWNESLNQHKNRYRIPEELTDDQAIDHFSKIGYFALKSLVSSYANQIRQNSKQPPIRLIVPPSLEKWIELQIASLDSVSGHLGSKTYKTIADEMLSELRAIEHTFLGRH